MSNELNEHVRELRRLLARAKKDGFTHEDLIARMSKKDVMLAAHRTFRDAVKHGEIERQSACEQCGSDRRIDAHHDDYSKPLKVRWLCGSCHTKHHWALRKSAADLIGGAV